MKAAILTLFFGLVVGIVDAQAPKEVYSLKDGVDVENILRRFNAENDKCGTEMFSVSSKAEIIISRQLDDNSFVIVVDKNSDGGNMAKPNLFYCISKSNLDNYFKRRTKPEIGLLVVPFKLRFDPIAVMAGSTVGPYIGKRFDYRNGTSGTLLGFAALTNVPLNDLNAAIPETKWGVGFGGGYVWTITERFQTGIITGIDIFEGVESWPYRFQPWLSVSIGFSFTSTKKEEEALNLAK